MPRSARKKGESGIYHITMRGINRQQIFASRREQHRRTVPLCYGSITTMQDLEANLAENCIPVEFMEMDILDYALFLDTRRTMMAQYIRDYYKGLD